MKSVFLTLSAYGPLQKSRVYLGPLSCFISDVFEFQTFLLSLKTNEVK